MKAPGRPRMAAPYIAPRSLSLDEHIRAWMAHAERRFEARAQDGGPLEIALMDVIGDYWSDHPVTADAVHKILQAHPGVREISVLINSPGGICSDGIAIYNLLKRSPAKVHVEVIGEVASAASVIAMAGDRITMRPGTWMMIHEAWGFAAGSAADMRSAAEYFDVCTEGANGIYAERSGQSIEEVRKMVQATTWMGAERAVELGFADDIGEEEREPGMTGDEDDGDGEPQIEVDVHINMSRQQRANASLMRSFFGQRPRR